jgi:chemotaxis methyl-accepting protein methylase
VRELVVFAQHNLLTDPPFSHLDLIVCRNLMIYLQRDVQQDVIALFHYALKPDGLLLLGTSETTDRSDLFRCEYNELCQYRQRNSAPWTLARATASETNYAGPAKASSRGHPRPMGIATER